MTRARALRTINTGGPMTGIRHFTASAIVLDDNGRVLLVHHNKVGLWLYPGGHIDPNEDPAQSALREHEGTASTPKSSATGSSPIPPSPPSHRRSPSWRWTSRTPRSGHTGTISEMAAHKLFSAVDGAVDMSTAIKVGALRLRSSAPGSTRGLFALSGIRRGDASLPLKPGQDHGRQRAYPPDRVAPESSAQSRVP
jgi:NUDIX domain